MSPEFPAWDHVLEVVEDIPVTVGDRLRTIYRTSPLREGDGPSMHTGMEAVYAYVQTLVARPPAGRHIVERQFIADAWGRDSTPWRQIAEFTGPESYADAVMFARGQTVTYTIPARYRVLRVDVLDQFETPARPMTLLEALINDPEGDQPDIVVLDD